MPELPEVESIRREIAPRIEGAVLSNVKIRRRDVLRDSRAAAGDRSRRSTSAWVPGSIASVGEASS